MNQLSNPADQIQLPVRRSARSVEPVFLVYLVVRVGLANTDDIHKSDASEEQERNDDLIEHVWHIGVCALLSLIATTLMTDYTGKDIEREHE